MKIRKRLLCLVVLLGTTCSLFAQNSLPKLTPQQSEKARKNAELEIKNLPQKGWVVNRADISFEEMMQNAWQFKFATDQKQIPLYIYTFGNGSGATPEAAYKTADRKARAQLPGLTMLYYSTWNMASKLSEKDKSLVSAAIDKAQKNIENELESWDIIPYVNMIRDSGSKKEVHLRYYYLQSESRIKAKALIKKELQKTTDWSNTQMEEALTYDR